MKKLIIALILMTGCSATQEIPDTTTAESFCVHHTLYMADIEKCQAKNEEAETPKYQALRDHCFERWKAGESMWDLAKEYRTQEQDIRLLTGCGV